jgi:hypothetical protein
MVPVGQSFETLRQGIGKASRRMIGADVHQFRRITRRTSETNGARAFYATLFGTADFDIEWLP